MSDSSASPLHKNLKKGRKSRIGQQSLAESAHSSSGLATPAVSRSRQEVQRAALFGSVVGQPFEDVKFWAYSRRTLDGAVDTPLPLLANSSLIRKASLHFVFLLAAGFAESGITEIDAPYPSTRLSFTDTYDFDSDSDLEDQDEGGLQTMKDESHAEVGRVADESPAIADAEKLPEGNSTSKQRSGPDESEGEYNAAKVNARRGRIVFLEDTAYATFRAFIIYTYLGEVEFAPLKSQNKARPSQVDPHKPPLCSPKSMYRLAEKYDIPDLKEEALKSIQSKLSPHNILEELFSTFTSLYPAVQAIELEYLHANSKDAGIRARLPKWLEAMEDGRLPKGAAGIVASLFDKFTTAPQKKPCPYCKTGTSTACAPRYCCSCGNTYT